MPIINVDHLTKQFKRRQKGASGIRGSLKHLFNPSYEIKTAVDAITFQVEAGEMIGYIGPNGAGKSTTIKMLAGILTPTSGSVEVAGCVPARDRAVHAKHIGVVFGQRTHLWWDVPVIDSLHLLRDIYKVPEARFRANLDRFEDLLGLSEFQAVPVRQLSLGQRVRADIAAALLHDPAILFLDEPTIGVDVISKDKLRTFIKEINRERQVTVLLTTHDMNEIEKMCPRVIVIDQGQLLYDGSLAHVRDRYSTNRLLVAEFEDDVPDALFTNLTLPGLNGHCEVTIQKSEQHKKWFIFNRAEVPVSALIAAISARSPVVDLTVQEAEIEEVIRKLYVELGSR